MKNKSNQEGFTLIEVLTAMVVLTIGILSMYAMQITAIRGNSNANQITTASNLALSQIEEILAWDSSDGRLLNANAVIIDQYTISWNGTKAMDPVNITQQVGYNIPVTVTWQSGAQAKIVSMYITKPI